MERLTQNRQNQKTEINTPFSFVFIQDLKLRHGQLNLNIWLQLCLRWYLYQNVNPGVQKNDMYILVDRFHRFVCIKRTNFRKLAFLSSNEFLWNQLFIFLLCVGKAYLIGYIYIYIYRNVSSSEALLLLIKKIAASKFCVIYKPCINRLITIIAPTKGTQYIESNYLQNDFLHVSAKHVFILRAIKYKG